MAEHGQVGRFVSVMIPLTGRRAGGVRGGGRLDSREQVVLVSVQLKEEMLKG